MTFFFFLIKHAKETKTSQANYINKAGNQTFRQTLREINFFLSVRDT